MHDFERGEELDGICHWRHRRNGLEVLLGATPVAPVASFGIVYRVGSRHEGSGATGATHLLEHLMFKGTHRFNRRLGTEVARVLQRLGASYNATTWLDRTNYYATVPVEHLSLVMEIEADRMRGALVSDEDLESERTVVLNELERGENEPFEELMKACFAIAYLEHPYHHPTIGWRSDVESVTGEVLRRFYDTYYHPDNATAIVAGAVDEKAALELLEQHFGALPSAPSPLPVIRARETEQRGERRCEVHRAAELGSLILAWHIPHGLHEDLPALSLLSQVLAEGVTSRLHQRLVETSRCLAVHAYALELHDPGLLQVHAALAPGASHSEVEEAILEEVDRLVAEPPGTAEMVRARTQLRTDLAFHRDSPPQIVAALTESVAMGDWRRFCREMELAAAVTREDVTRVASVYLRRGNLTVGTFVPEGDGVTGLPLAPGPLPSC